MVRILALLSAFALTACAASKAAEKTVEPATMAAADADPCAGKAGRELVECKKSGKDVKTKFLFKSSAGGASDDAGASGDSDDDDDDD